MSHPLPEKLSFCKFTKRWIICEIPKKCCNECTCENCNYHEERPLNSYIKKKLRRLEKENEV